MGVMNFWDQQFSSLDEGRGPQGTAFLTRYIAPGNSKRLSIANPSFP